MTITTEALQSLRQNYKQGRLSEFDCPNEPHKLLSDWVKVAVETNCDEPNAFTLSTIFNGAPSARVVLMKGISEKGITFFTNYESQKGKQIALIPKVAATFLWLPLERQVRIEGIVSKLSPAKSDEYFNRRPYGSRIGALASPQGEVVVNREFLEKRFQEYLEKYPDGSTIPRPETWGGYLITPTLVEFWQGRENRLHDRVRYRTQGNGWIKERLAP